MDFLLRPIEAIHDLVGLGYCDMPHVCRIVKPNLLTEHILQDIDETSFLPLLQPCQLSSANCSTAYTQH